MGDKASSKKVSIFLSMTDPSHLQAAEILSQQGYRGKAQYIVNAVLHYEGYTETPGAKRPARFDEKVIEAVVNRILKDKEISTVGRSTEKPADTSAVANGDSAHMLLPVEYISYDDALDELGEGGLEAVLGALEMFRRE